MSETKKALTDVAAPVRARGKWQLRQIPYPIVHNIITFLSSQGGDGFD